MLDYAEASQAEAQQLAEAITHLDAVLARGSFTGDAATEVASLRAKATTTLVDLRTGLESLRRVNDANIFGVDPALATQHYALTRVVEKSKVTFELDILPGLRVLARAEIEHTRAAPPDHVDAERLPEPAPAEGGWTAERVLDSAENLVNQSDRAAGVVTKLMSVARALSLVIGLAPV